MGGPGGGWGGGEGKGGVTAAPQITQKRGTENNALPMGGGRGKGGDVGAGRPDPLSRVGRAVSLEEKMIPGLKGLWGLKEGDPVPRDAAGSAGGTGGGGRDGTRWGAGAVRACRQVS